MQRIDNNSAISAIPPPGPPGTPGFFSEGNPAAGLEATIVDAWWANAVQEEILYVITQAGIVPNKSNNTQLYEALNHLYAAAGGNFLPLAGGLMTGFITLHAPPTLPMHATNRQYVDDAVNAAMSGTGYVPEAPPGPFTYGRLNAMWNPVLPLTGGSLSGSLTITSWLVVDSDIAALNLYASAAIRQGAAPALANAISAVQVVTTQDAFIGGVVRLTNPPREWRIWNDGSLHFIPPEIGASAMYLQLFGRNDISSGMPVHRMEVNGEISCNYHITCHGMHPIIAWVTANYQNVNYAIWNSNTDYRFYVGKAQWDGSTPPGSAFSYWNTSGNFHQLFQAWKPGGGTWSDLSDVRAKKDIARYEQGLDAICRLRPVTYRFNGLAETYDDGQIYHGLIAQEVQEVMPEMVTEEAIKLHADDVEATSLYATNCSPLTFALVNAVRELAERLEIVEGRK